MNNNESPTLTLTAVFHNCEPVSLTAPTTCYHPPSSVNGPFILTTLITYLVSERVPAYFKHAIVYLDIKKTNLDLPYSSNFRSVSVYNSVSIGESGFPRYW